MTTTPTIGFGTFRLKGSEVEEPLRDAIALGYRHIDTAAIYKNESEIGSILQDLYATTSLLRSSLHITSKLSPYDLASPREALLKSLSKLQTSYLDIYLIHWPAVARTDSSSGVHRQLRLEAWKVLNEAKCEGLVREIGVSNFTVQHVRELQATEWGIRGCWVQMECHPWYRKDAVEMAKTFADEGVKITGYSLLAEGRLLERRPAAISEIAEKRGVSVVQVVLAWALSKNIRVLVRSVDESHLRENLEAGSLELTAEECSVIDHTSSQDTEEKLCWDPRQVK